MKGIYTICLCLLLCAAHAQEGEQAADTTYGVLDEIVFSASRWEQNLREIPGRVATVRQSQIQLQNPQTAADLLGFSNQVFIQKSQLGGGSPMIRGFATNRVMLVVDGVRMNNAIFRGGNLQNVISLDPNVIREAEVIFGPGSVIYGSDAIGGVMDFHTFKPTLSTEKSPLVKANVFARYASANEERTYHADISVGFRKWGLLTSVSQSDFSDLLMGSNGPDDYLRPDYQRRINNADAIVPNPNPRRQVSTGYSQNNFTQKVTFLPNAFWALDYGFHFSKTSDVPRYDRLLLKSGNGNFTSGEWYYGPQQWMMHALTARHTKATKLSDQMKFTVGFQDYEESRHNRNFNSSNRTNRFEEVRALSVNIDADKQVGERLSLFYGAEFINNKIYSTANRRNITSGAVVPWSTRYPNNSDWRSMAIYTSARYRLNDNWLVNASARYTHVYSFTPFDTTFFKFPFTEATLNNGALNGSLGVVYSPAEASKLYANLSTGFRAPNVDDVGKVFDSQPGNVVVPNPGLKPETAYNVEAGFTSNLDEKLSVDVALYTTWLDNAIARSTFLFNAEDSINYDGQLSRVLALQNINELRVSGLQIGVRWTPVTQLTISTNYNLQRGSERDPETGKSYSPTHVAPDFGTTQIAWAAMKWSAMLYANYNREISFNDLALTERADAHIYAKDGEGNPYAPSWFTLNVKGFYQVNKYVRLDIGVENIFDKRYRPYSSGISAPGRNFIVTLRASL